MEYSAIMQNRILQSVTWHGKEHKFFRKKQNEFGEDNGEPAKVATLKGIYHSGSSDHKSITRTESGYTVDKNTPYILTTWEAAKNLKLQDCVTINSKHYRVTGITNVHETGTVGEISLEVVL